MIYTIFNVVKKEFKILLLTNFKHISINNEYGYESTLPNLCPLIFFSHLCVLYTV